MPNKLWQYHRGTKGEKLARTDAQLKFRIPPDLKPKLEVAARMNKRSVSMEVVARLEESFKAEAQRGARKDKPANTEFVINNVVSRLTEIEEALAALQRRVSLVAMAEIRARKSKI
jgi:hypothetical protein